MSVDTRAHITSSTLQERAVLRRTFIWGTGPDDGSGRYARRKAVSVRGHSGDDVRMTLADLGAALRVLGVKPADMGYKPPRPRIAPGYSVSGQRKP